MRDDERYELAVQHSPHDGEERHNLRLSPREREVLQLLAEGHEVRTIAATLAVSPDTVRAHLRSARARLRARSRPHAVALALVRGQIQPVRGRTAMLDVAASID